MARKSIWSESITASTSGDIERETWEKEDGLTDRELQRIRQGYIADDD